MRNVLPAAFLFASTMSLLGQGALVPSGTPGPLYKTLNQIEPRTPISAAPLTINTPGSYYLTANVSVSTGNAITINTSNVTLDLNGFTISSTQNPATNGAAIFINPGFSNITIMNGNVNSGVGFSGSTYSGTGFGYGIFRSGSSNNLQVRGVNVFGVLVNGIDLSILDSSTVQNCTVTTAGSYGIVADSVSNSTAQNTGNSAILANNALNSTGSSNANHGVQATSAMNCRGTAAGASNAGHGIAANTASNCYGTSAGSGNGVDTDGAANSCVGIANGSGYGVHSTHVAANCQGMSNSVGVAGDDSVVGCTGTGSTGILSFTNVSNSYGVGTGTGINCAGAFFSQGRTNGGNFGIECDMAIGCLGYSTSGYGIYTSGAGSVVAFSLARGSSFAIQADIIYASAVIIPGGSLVGHQYFCGSGANPYP